MKRPSTLDSSSYDEIALRRYLLGDLTEDEEARQEELLLTDARYYERLVLAEDDLIDDYVGGRLTANDKERMERRFLASANRQEKLKLATDLRRLSVQESRLVGIGRIERALTPKDIARSLFSRDRRPATILLLATALLLIASAVVIFVQVAELRGKIDALGRDQLRAQQRDEELRKELAAQTARSDQLSRDLQKEQIERIRLEQALKTIKQPIPGGPRSNDTELLAITLASGRTRDRGPLSLIQLTPSAKRVMLDLSLEHGSYKSYRAVLQTDEGKQIWIADHLKASRIKDDERVRVLLPARLLVPGDYTITLSPTVGLERVGTYYFTTARKQ
ncbi:MAG TPA: hypothetical protein VFV34_24600 [Blastocatellia bacterium]|nr:hypothetical protein [Blastocatellia bacterium]